VKGEALIHEKTGGTKVGGKAPVDVVTKFGGRTQGIEVKSLTKQDNDKITMRRDALERKADWTKENKAPIHTVVVDWRDKSHPDPSKYSGHRIYFRAGTGSFRLGSMIKVQSSAHLKQLLSKRY